MLYTKKNAEYLPVNDDGLISNILKSYFPGGEDDYDDNEVMDEPGDEDTNSDIEDLIEEDEPVLDEEDLDENDISDEDVEDIEWSDDDDDDEDNEDMDDPSKD